jgi:tetratricopeptide (TPR) repeat protein
MAELGFLLKAQKKKSVADAESKLIFKTDLEAFLTYTRNNNSYLAVSDNFRMQGLTEEELEVILYRLRLRNNETHVVFHNMITDNYPLKKQSVANAGAVDKYIYYGACQMLGEHIDYSYAREKFDRALQLDNKATLAYANLGSLAVMSGNKTEALQWFNKALEIEPYHAQVLANKLELIVDMPHTTLKEFESTVELLLANDPLHPTALNYRIQLAIYRSIPYTALSYLKVYYPHYYLESDAIKLLKNVLASLPLFKARQAFLDIKQATAFPKAKRILEDFNRYYFY